jgi:hypothetical protein
MKKLLIFLFFIPLFIPNLAHAQIKEINPSIQWRFVKSQELTLKDGNWYSYEFVADKGFDYIFTLTHYSDLAKASIQVFNLQDDKIAEFKADSSKITAALEFDVKQSGTYKVFLGVNIMDIPDQTEVPILFTLIRREKV